jgi:pimeloyl-ACP methyl ester carboxylesterase
VTATFGFIHGAGDVGWYWHLVEAELRRRGHDTVAPDLPIDDDTAGLTEYADVVTDAIGKRPDVVVVAQSFGGYVAPIVAERVGARSIVLVAGMVLARRDRRRDVRQHRLEPERPRIERAVGVLPRRPVGACR